MNTQTPKPTGPDPGQARNQTEPGLDTHTTAETIVETMQNPDCEAEQLPELWELWQKHAKTCRDKQRNGPHDHWSNTIETMFQRCETYPEHAKLVAVLQGMPYNAWYYRHSHAHQSDKLLKQATPEQLREALSAVRRSVLPLSSAGVLRCQNR